MKRKFVSASLLLLSTIAFCFTSCKKENLKSTTSVNSTTSDEVVEKQLATSLVARYPFNGNTKDVSGKNNNVAVISGAVPAAGKSGTPKTAYYFNGASYMEVPNSASLNMDYISLVAQVKIQGFYQGACHGNRIISKGYNDFANGRYTLSFSDMLYYNYAGCNFTVQPNFQNFEGGFGNGQASASGTVDSSHYIKQDKWYTVIYTYDGAFSKLYVNGSLVSSAQISTSFTPNTSSLFIGRNEDPGYPYYFTGVIDEIRIYNKALNPAQVKSITNVLQ